MSPDLILRIMERVEKRPDGCWESAWEPSAAYSRIWDGSRMFAVHRAMYEHHVAPLDPELTIDHTCRNKRCCNPAHLRQITREENGFDGFVHSVGVAKRGGGKKTTRCPAGHRYSAKDVKPCGAKQCRRCENARRRKRAA